MIDDEVVERTEAAAEDVLRGSRPLRGNLGAGRLRKSDLLRAVIEHFPGGIALFDHGMRMVLCNERLKEMLDYPASLFAAGAPTLERLFTFNAERGEYGAGDKQDQVARRLALARERQPHVYERVRPNGMVLEVRGAPLESGGFITTYFDVTERRRAQDLTSHMAHHDGLTGLANRTSFHARLRDAAERIEAPDAIAVHYIDLDGFKAINDTKGHAMGDALLVAVAKRLQRTVRDTDTVARLGGDEFAILQVGVQAASHASALARRLIETLRVPFEIEGQSLRVGASIGIALSEQQNSTADELLAAADRALYRSKAEGRCRFSFSSGAGSPFGYATTFA